MRKLKEISWLIIGLFLLLPTVYGQEVNNEFQSRTEMELVFKPIKKFKLTLMPQFRFDENFSLDKYLLETGVEYKALKYLELGATYRFVVNPRNTKSTEYHHRYAFDATTKREFKRFETAFRLRYSNYADDEIDDKEFIRYKIKLNYNIKKCKLTPLMAVEAFQQLNDGKLYKMRYTLGADYKLFKNNFLSVSYKFDYYKNEYKNRHIISLGYKIKI